MTEFNPLEDPERLEAVRASGLLDSAPQPEFDRLARIAAQLLHAPAAFVTVISDDRQYLKSAMADGERSSAAGSSTPLDRSFCQHAVAAGEPFIVEDARQHRLVKDNKAVAEGVIAYAGIPLRTRGGQSIGALCVVDSTPRHWTNEDVENLRSLARGAMQLIDERKPDALRETSQSYEAGDETLVQCVSRHLRAASAYAALVSGGEELDLDREAVARDRLTQSMADLERCYRAHDGKASDAELAAALGPYLEADTAREQAARAFRQGTVELAALEAAIQRHMDAADSLRIIAIDRGAEFE